MDNGILILIFGMGLLLLIVVMFDKLHNDLATINRTLKNIAKHMGVKDEVMEALNVELEDLVVQGKRIQAVKRCRAATGFGLKEADDYVNNLIIKKK